MDLCKGCGNQLHFVGTVCHLEEGNKRWHQQFPKSCVHNCKDDKRSELPMNIAVTML